MAALKRSLAQDPPAIGATPAKQKRAKPAADRRQRSLLLPVAAAEKPSGSPRDPVGRRHNETRKKGLKADVKRSRETDLLWRSGVRAHLGRMKHYVEIRQSLVPVIRVLLHHPDFVLDAPDAAKRAGAGVGSRRSRAAAARFRRGARRQARGDGYFPGPLWSRCSDPGRFGCLGFRRAAMCPPPGELFQAVRVPARAGRSRASRRGFAPDSPLEGDAFEPSVPQTLT